MSDRISLIVPVYNAAKNLDRWFKHNVFEQTRRPHELVFINDGSTDATASIARSYEPKLQELNIDFIYIQLENLGVSASLNAGLKVFTGDYLAWTDHDDFMAPDSLEKRVAFLESHPDYGFVRSDGYIFDCHDLKTPTGLLSAGRRNRFKEDIFDDLIMDRAIMQAGLYVARASAFLKVNPTRSIYPSRAEQNWQILLPLARHYRCGFIDEPLLNYIVYPTSLSHRARTLQDFLQMVEDHIDILSHVLQSIEGMDWPHYQKLLTLKYARHKLELARLFNNRSLAQECVHTLRMSRDCQAMDLVRLQCAKWRALNLLWKIVKRINWSTRKTLLVYRMKMKPLLAAAHHYRYKGDP